MGHEAACELLATKTVVPEALRAVYSHCAIIEAPLNLPDGDYEVEFAGEVAVTRRQGGSWTVGAVMPHTYQEAAQLYASNQQPGIRKGEVARKRSKGSDAIQSTVEPE
jgi:hypothetical protein